MRKKENFLPIFILLFIISFIFFKTNFSLGFFERIIIPVQKLTNDFFSLPKNIFSDSELEKIKEENLAFIKKLSDKEEILRENNALKDQFKTTNPQSSSLLQAKIVGSPNFIPGITFPEVFILDKGKKDGVRLGQAVVFKDNIVGKVSKISDRLSETILLTNKQSLFAAKTLSADRQASKTVALGVVRGYGNGEAVLENVLLSDSLVTNDIVLTKGDLDINGIGYPPDLIVGKIISIDKKASSLFQSAKVKNLLDFSKLSIVFIIQN